LSEGARAVEPEQPPLGAQVLRASKTGGTVSTSSKREERIEGVITTDSAHGLVSEDERGAALASVPAIGMEVRSADPGHLDVHHNLTFGRLRRIGLLDRQVRAPMPNECVQGLSMF
jgi:hypothetical protein